MIRTGCSSGVPAENYGLSALTGRPDRLRVFSDAEIQFCLMAKVLFGLPLLQITGMVSGILEMAGLE